ncbi:hypothetical protein FV139_00545 [Parahaliea maris]|uniref:DNA-binding protein n=1 Tax=Parahaliea maris TaxID=2716870 RepID=A0A5C9A8M2_9GAMM|nr:hypothetical protein [Parahaliea maris]TXS96030.1 hypothetical protein FV139_00545 [Parahaliea maris]
MSNPNFKGGDIFPKHYSFAEAEEVSGLSQSYLRKKKDLGQLPVYQFGGSGQMVILHTDLVGLLKLVEIPGAKKAG